MANIPVVSQRPYFDDYNPNKRFQRILFRPGIPVQTRELTQLQTMMQDQLGRFADSVYKNGSLVIPGDVKVNQSFAYVRVTNPGTVNLADYVGGEISEIPTTPGAPVISGTISYFFPQVGADPDTIYVSYRTNRVNSNGINVGTFSPGSTVRLTKRGFVPYDIQIRNESNATGVGASIQMNAGVYYFNSLFIPVESQTLILQKYTSALPLTKQVGLLFKNVIITEANDSSLLDNASGSTNFTAPGGHRLRVDAILIDANDVLPNDKGSFVEILRINDGIVSKRVDSPEFSTLQQALARRTYDASGDYIIDPFILDIREHRDNGTNRGVFKPSEGGVEPKLVYELDPGRAYVRGYEVEKVGKSRLEINKTRKTQAVNDEYSFAAFGRYFLFNFDTGITSSNGGSDFIKTISAASVDVESSIQLLDGADAIIGYAIASGFKRHSDTHMRLYVGPLWLNSGKTVGEIAKVKRNNITITLNAPAGENAYNDSGQIPILKLTNNVVASVGECTYYNQTQIDTQATLDGSNVVATVNFSEGESSANRSDYVIFNTTTGAFIDEGVTVISSTVNSATLFFVGIGSNTVTDGDYLKVYARARINNSTSFVRTKTFATKTVSVTNPGSEVWLNFEDGIRLVSVYKDGDTGVDYKDSFVFNGGQTDYAYFPSRVTRRRSVPAGTYAFTFEHYEHTGGAFFCSNSYNAEQYGTNPKYRTGTGVEIELLKCFDFRPTLLRTTSTPVTLNQLIPKFPITPLEQQSEIEKDYSYYLGRIDKIVLGSDGVFKVISGVDSITPTVPKDATNAITLYIVTLPPYIFRTADIIQQRLEYRRFTMKDISEIEQRLNSLEYYTALNLLEQNTLNIDIGDRLRSGFMADPFTSFTLADLEDDSYAASIDPAEGGLRPEVAIKNVDLDIDTAITPSANLKLVGPNNDIVTVNYTERTVVDQPLASELMRVNPFAIFSWIGFAQITPGSDTWFTTHRLPDVIDRIDITLPFDADAAIAQARGWNRWDWGWGWGRARGWDWIWGGWNMFWNGDDRFDRSLSIRTSTSTGDASQIRAGVTFGQAQDISFGTGVMMRDLDFTSVIRTEDNRVVSTAALPFIRSREISFSLTRLKPFTRLHLLFDNKNISEYIQPTGKARGAALVTDGAGACSGTFTIPNNESIRFRSGTKEVIFTSDVADPLNAETYARTVYTAQGYQNNVQSRFLSVRTRVPVVEVNPFAVRRNFGWSDPLAQSFLVDIPGGACISSVDLFFGEDPDLTDSVTVQLRTMVNGYPGPDILPLGEVVLSADEIKPFMSADASKACRFTFPAPVMIQENTEYCIAVLSNSPTLSCWVARMGEKARNVGDTTTNTGQSIGKQPYAGVLFKSQNNSTWTADQTADLKIKINRAVFNTSANGGSIVFKNVIQPIDTNTEVDSYYTQLTINPFETVNTDNDVTVKQPNHGFAIGDKVKFGIDSAYISGYPATLNGIPYTAIVGPTHTVTAILNDDEYVITLVDNSNVPIVANATGSCGSAGVYANQQIEYSSIRLITNQLKPSNTEVTWGFRGNRRSTVLHGPTKGTVISGSDVIESTFAPINEGTQVDLRRTYISKTASDGSISVQATLKTSVDNVAPFVDIERLSATCVGYRIDNGNDLTNNVVDTFTAKTGTGTSQTRYITKVASLINPANQIRVYVDGNRPSDTDFTVFCKIDGGDWQTLRPMADYTNPGSDDSGRFREFRFERNFGATSFKTFAVKIVLSSTAKNKTPILKNFRAIAIYDTV